jgi:hypothetical protein
MSNDKSAKFADFWHKVEKATKKDLTKGQRELLHASLLLAWLATAQEAELEMGFDGSFTPEQAALLTQYQSGSGPVHMLPRLVDHPIPTDRNSIRTTTKSIRT